MKYVFCATKFTTFYNNRIRPTTIDGRYIERKIKTVKRKKIEEREEGWIKFIARKINQREENEQINHTF